MLAMPLGSPCPSPHHNLFWGPPQPTVPLPRRGRRPSPARQPPSTSAFGGSLQPSAPALAAGSRLLFPHLGRGVRWVWFLGKKKGPGVLFPALSKRSPWCSGAVGPFSVRGERCRAGCVSQAGGFHKLGGSLPRSTGPVSLRRVWNKTAAVFSELCASDRAPRAAWLLPKGNGSAWILFPNPITRNAARFRPGLFSPGMRRR